GGRWRHAQRQAENNGDREPPTGGSASCWHGKARARPLPSYYKPFPVPSFRDSCFQLFIPRLPLPTGETRLRVLDTRHSVTATQPCAELPLVGADSHRCFLAPHVPNPSSFEDHGVAQPCV